MSISGLMTRPGLNLSAFTCVTAPVMFPARCSPYPVTTISARLIACAVSATSTTIVSPVTFTGCSAGA